MSPPRPRPGILEIEPYVGGKASVASAQADRQAVEQREPTGPEPEGRGGLP